MIIQGSFTDEFLKGYQAKFKKIEKLKYYVHDQVSLLNRATNTWTWTHWDGHESFIDKSFADIDKEIDLDFEKVTDHRKAHIEIYRISPDSPFVTSAGLLGIALASSEAKKYARDFQPTAKSFGTYRIALWAGSENDTSDFVSGYSLARYNQLHTIIHELGHTLGLSHPQIDGRDDPSGAWHTDKDTIMSYNENPTKTNYQTNAPTWSSLDIQTLKNIWGEDNDLVTSTTTYMLKDNEENLTLIGSDPINGFGNKGNNILIGNNANNLLDGGIGADILEGREGDDTYVVDNKNENVIEHENQGTDTIRVGFSYELKNHIECLVLTGNLHVSGVGNQLDNALWGNSGKNTLNGKEGNDVLTGNLGKDVLTGSSGGDKFVFRSIKDSGIGSKARDIITDFNGAEGDVIDISTIDAYAKTPGLQSFSYIGSASFTGSQGEARFANGILQLNTGSDRKPDMEIALAGVTAFHNSFLII
jgi:Ca2+-binding RTX toxin-like protein